MEELIRQAFVHVDVIGPHVMDGHYDLLGPNGEIILPQVWETVIEPDWSITMHMWPMPEPPPPPEDLVPPPPPPGPEGLDGAAPSLDDAIVNIEELLAKKGVKPGRGPSEQLVHSFLPFYANIPIRLSRPKP